MPEEILETTDENTPETGAEETSTSAGEASTPETKEDPTVPHSRVKEMVEKAKQKGRDEALKELLSKNEEDTKPAVAPPQVGRGNEQEEAIRILRETIRSEIGPYFARQEVEQFLDKNPEALNYIDKIKGLRTDNPKLSWDQALKLASFDDKVKKAEATGASKAEQSKAEKRAAQTEKPIASSGDKPRSLADKLRDTSVPLSEIEKEMSNYLKSQSNR